MSSLTHAVKLDIGRLIRNIGHSLNRMAVPVAQDEAAAGETAPFQTDAAGVRKIETLSEEAKGKLSEKLRRLMDAENETLARVSPANSMPAPDMMSAGDRKHWPAFLATEQQKRTHRALQDRQAFNAVIAKLLRSKLPAPLKAVTLVRERAAEKKITVKAASGYASGCAENAAGEKRAERKSGILNKIEDAWNHRLSVI